MFSNQVENDQHDEQPTESSMNEMMQACPCGGLLKRHRFAMYTALTVAGLGILALQAGWVLGIIAFFRTI